MDRMAYNKDGGIFAGFFSADWMRALSYKLANVTDREVRYGRDQRIRLGVLERTVDRKWVKLKWYLKHLQNRLGEVGNLFLLNHLSSSVVYPYHL